MSEENVEIVRRQIERFQAGMERGDPGAVFDAETVAADAEWIVREGMDADEDRVVALTRQSGTGKGSGVPVELDLGLIYELKDGRVIRITNYLTHAEALEAAGLSE
jgi:hypothetical protein